jgi:hypothetical protein
MSTEAAVANPVAAVTEPIPFYVTCGEIDTCVDALSEKEAAVKAILSHFAKPEGDVLSEVEVQDMMHVRRHASGDMQEDDMLFETSEIFKNAGLDGEMSWE